MNTPCCVNNESSREEWTQEKVAPKARAKRFVLKQASSLPSLTAQRRRGEGGAPGHCLIAGEVFTINFFVERGGAGFVQLCRHPTRQRIVERLTRAQWYGERALRKGAWMLAGNGVRVWRGDAREMRRSGQKDARRRFSIRNESRILMIHICKSII